VTYCSNCGKALEDESNFCPKCGVRTEKGAKEGVTIPWSSDSYWRQEFDLAIAKASKAIDEGVKLFRDTFYEVVQEVDKSVKTAKANVTEMTTPPHCKSCGSENTNYAKYCTTCGELLTSILPQPEQT
jgi:predicted Zn-ribbon and HTH transcriptional regulator